ncbi:MAG: ARMT1-like domain-containing protein [Candidatus Cloacimonetes bacterium]|nr:ARMT1-like domain-containing protein [Candidatus Cloacimonadota bacterium]
MKTNFDCVTCIVRQTLDALRQVTSDEAVIERILRSTLSTAAGIDYSMSPAEIGTILHRKIREETGNQDPYLEIKNKANKAARGLLPFLRRMVEDSPNPFATAVKYAIAGNVFDFALFTQKDKDVFRKSLGEVHTKELDPFKLYDLRSKIFAAKSILLIGDNAGEVVFDRLLLEQFPSTKIYYAVKSKPAINDVLRADAIFAGIDQYAEIISNGNDAAGTVLAQCSPEFMDVFCNVDLVIAKGQGNYETLNNCDREIFFLTQIKCNTVAHDLQGAIGDWVVAQSVPRLN